MVPRTDRLMTMTGEVCTDACRRFQQDGTRLSMTRVCNHPTPRLFADEPWTIKVVTMDGPNRDDPLGQYVTVAFKTQCVGCRGLFGAWDRNIETVGLPQEESIRQQAMVYLLGQQFLVCTDGVTCPDCFDPDTPHPDLVRLRLLEGVPPQQMTGWLTW